MAPDSLSTMMADATMLTNVMRLYHHVLSILDAIILMALTPVIVMMAISKSIMLAWTLMNVKNLTFVVIILSVII